MQAGALRGEGQAVPPFFPPAAALEPVDEVTSQAGRRPSSEDIMGVLQGLRERMEAELQDLRKADNEKVQVKLRKICWDC